MKKSGALLSKDELVSLSTNINCEIYLTIPYKSILYCIYCFPSWTSIFIYIAHFSLYSCYDIFFCWSPVSNFASQPPAFLIIYVLNLAKGKHVTLILYQPISKNGSLIAIGVTKGYTLWYETLARRIFAESTPYGPLKFATAYGWSVSKIRQAACILGTEKCYTE